VVNDFFSFVPVVSTSRCFTCVRSVIFLVWIFFITVSVLVSFFFWIYPQGFKIESVFFLFWLSAIISYRNPLGVSLAKASPSI